MVSYWFPQEFPLQLKGFLNSVYESAPRKEETFEGLPAWTLGFYGFLGWKPFRGLESFCFLWCFLRVITSQL